MLINTVQEVTNQLSGMNCPLYNIGMFQRDIRKMTILYNLSSEEIISLADFLLIKNSNGCDIFISVPVNDDNILLLLDDICYAELYNLKVRGLEPSCVVETSKDNYQAWISLGKGPMSIVQRRITIKTIVKEFHCDPACVSATHFGRLAGYRNLKPEHCINNAFPFIYCHEYSGVTATKSDITRQWAVKMESKITVPDIITIKNTNNLLNHHHISAIDAFGKYYDEWIERTLVINGTIDYSIGDFAVTCRMLKERFSSDEISDALRYKSPNINERKRNHVEDYIFRTIKAAKRKI